VAVLLRNYASIVGGESNVRKIAFLVAAVFVSSFALEHADNLRAHRGFAGSSAFAQDTDDSADTPDALRKLPNVGGSYDGIVVDLLLGTGTLLLNLTQNGSKLTGSLQAEFGSETLTGIVTGSVKTNWDVSFKFFRPGHRCTDKASGKWTPHSTGDEIAFTYKSQKCTPPSMGMGDAFE